MSPRCPECGMPMALRQTTKFVCADGSPKKFYGCTGFPKCKETHGAHPDGRPLGFPANKEVKLARRLAHLFFDAYWQSRGLDRSAGYLELQRIMGLSTHAAHIGMFDKEKCALLIYRIRKLSREQFTGLSLLQQSPKEK